MSMQVHAIHVYTVNCWCFRCWPQLICPPSPLRTLVIQLELPQVCASEQFCMWPVHSLYCRCAQHHFHGRSTSRCLSYSSLDSACSLSHKQVFKACYCVLMQVAASLDKLSTRERFLNTQCHHLTAEYAEAKEQLSRLQVQYNQKQDAVNEQDMELGRIMKVSLWL